MNYQYIYAVYHGVVTPRNYDAALSSEHVFQLPGPMDKKLLASNEAAYDSANAYATAARVGSGEYKCILQKDYRDAAGNRTQPMVNAAYWNLDLQEVKSIRAAFDRITDKPGKPKEEEA